MSYDPLRQRVTHAQSYLDSQIRRAKQDLHDAKTRLAVLEEVEVSLNLEALAAAIPMEPKPD